jgi:IS30 family transposase
VLGAFKAISERPDTIGDRWDLRGHWKGELIIGARNASAILTLNERLSRTCWMCGVALGLQRRQRRHSPRQLAATMPTRELISLT